MRIPSLFRKQSLEFSLEKLTDDQRKALDMIHTLHLLKNRPYHSDERAVSSCFGLHERLQTYTREQFVKKVSKKGVHTYSITKKGRGRIKRGHLPPEDSEYRRACLAIIKGQFKNELFGYFLS